LLRHSGLNESWSGEVGVACEMKVTVAVTFLVGVIQVPGPKNFRYKIR
jgi:hypothetical protein